MPVRASLKLGEGEGPREEVEGDQGDLVTRFAAGIPGITLDSNSDSPGLPPEAGP